MAFRLEHPLLLPQPLISGSSTPNFRCKRPKAFRAQAALPATAQPSGTVYSERSHSPELNLPPQSQALFKLVELLFGFPPLWEKAKQKVSELLSPYLP